MRKIKMAGLAVLMVCILILVFWTGRGIRYWLMDGRAFDSREEPEEDFSESSAGEPEEPKYRTDTLPENCKLCGDGEGTLLPLYEGQDNLGIISLNTFHVDQIEINRYDDYGRLIEEPESGMGTNILNTGDGGYMSVVTANSNRGYASAEVSMNQDKYLDMEKASENLCTDCMNAVMESSWSEPYGIGLINFKTGEIKMFHEKIRGFTFGDYYVICEPRAEMGEEEISEIDMDIFYCPERYK